MVRTLLLLIGLFVFVDIAGAQSAGSQPPADPNPGALSLSGGIDFMSTYMFRGIRQHSTGVAAWPWADVGIAAYSGAGRIKSVSADIGSWNSQHTGDTGVHGPSHKLWYESDFYATLGLAFGGGVSLATTYTTYTSPNNTFSSVKEIMVKLAADDSARFGKAAIKPYVIVARELDTAPGAGQADAGARAGTYFEAGVAPGYAGAKASVSVPVRIGLSLGHYYELDGTDDRFGFLSVAGLVTVPLGATSKYGTWNVHGGVEFQKLGDHTAALNGSHGHRGLLSIGIGFSY